MSFIDSVAAILIALFALGATGLYATHRGRKGSAV